MDLDFEMEVLIQLLSGTLGISSFHRHI